MTQLDTFASTLAYFRERKGYSQERLADCSGYNRAYLSRLEGGHRHPTRESIGRLADALDLRPYDRSYLFRCAGLIDDADPLFRIQREEIPIEISHLTHLLQSQHVHPAMKRAIMTTVGTFLALNDSFTDAAAVVDEPAPLLVDFAEEVH